MISFIFLYTVPRSYRAPLLFIVVYFSRRIRYLISSVRYSFLTTRESIRAIACSDSDATSAFAFSMPFIGHVRDLVVLLIAADGLSQYLHGARDIENIILNLKCQSDLTGCLLDNLLFALRGSRQHRS